jgi:hypothetical protein
MAFNVDTFRRSGLTKGGVRPSQFEIILPAQVVGNAARGMLLCQAASLPASTVGTIEVPYFGRKVKVAGDRTFAEWTVTVMADEDDGIYQTLMGWMHDNLNTHIGNTRDSNYANGYKYPIVITQYGKEGAGSVINSFVLDGAWPSDVAQVDLDWNTTDTIQTYQVTWQYDFWLSGTSDVLG